RVDEPSRPGAEALRGLFGDPARSIPEHWALAPFGNPADSGSPVALRPRLAAGVLFRGAWNVGPRLCHRGARIRSLRMVCKAPYFLECLGATPRLHARSGGSRKRPAGWG